MFESIIHPLTAAVVATLAGARVVVSIDPASKPANDSKLCVFTHLAVYKVSNLQPCIYHIHY